MYFIKSFKNVFLNVLKIFNVFLCCFKCRVVAVVKTNVHNYKYDAFLIDKWLPCVVCSLVRVRHSPFPGQSRCFVAVLLTLFDLC